MRNKFCDDAMDQAYDAGCGNGQAQPTVGECHADDVFLL